MERTREPLDAYDERPRAMTSYLRHNGWHFNEALAQWAVSKMRDRDGNQVEYWDRMRVEDLLSQYGERLENLTGMDHVYICAMCRADYLGRSVPNEQYMAMFIKDTIDDRDAPDGTTFARWYATMCRAGMPVPWSEVI